MASLIAILLWCCCGYLILHKKRKEIESQRASTQKVDRPEITDPLFRELYDEYAFNQLEGFTQNTFFHTWTTFTDDHNNVISLCFRKNRHEIQIDFSETEISITIDEETDSPFELVLKTQDFKNLDEVFNAITAICREAISGMDKP